MAVGEMEKGLLGRSIAQRMGELTSCFITEWSLKNAAVNAPRIASGQSIGALQDTELMEGEDALVIAAGPSMHRVDTAGVIRRSGFDGVLIATDGSLVWCLRNGLVPDLVVTLDPGDTRIVRWFGDPHLTEEMIRKDDYFERQEMDPAFTRDQLENNRKLIELIDRHGPQIRSAVCSSAAPMVVDRIYQCGMRPYWWNPMFDDYDAPQSVTRKIYESNGLPCINAGGNVGTACWVFAHAVLAKKRVGIIGMDLGYYADRPYSQTQYYNEILELVGPERLHEVFVHIHNPHLNMEFYTDPAYLWYRDCFLEAVQEAECRTYNCTGGGILFGPGIEWASLDDFLNHRV